MEELLKEDYNELVQQQIDEFIAEGASWLPTRLLRDLLCPMAKSAPFPG